MGKDRSSKIFVATSKKNHHSPREMFFRLNIRQKQLLKFPKKASSASVRPRASAVPPKGGDPLEEAGEEEGGRKTCKKQLE